MLGVDGRCFGMKHPLLMSVLIDGCGDITLHFAKRLGFRI